MINNKIIASKGQLYKTMIKNKFYKLQNRILVKRCKKLPYNCIMSARSLVLRICFIQGLINSWLR